MTDPVEDGRTARLVTAAAWLVLGVVTAGLPLLILADRLTLAGLWPALPPLGPWSPPSPRISQPLGYWNAIGLWCAVACVVQVLSAAHAGHRFARRAAGATIPLILAAGYLTYSRGAILTALVGLLVALALAPRRRALVLQLVAVSLPAAAAVGVVAADTGVAFGERAAHPWTVVLLGLAAGGGAMLADRAGGAAWLWRIERIQERVAGIVDRRIGRRTTFIAAGLLVVVVAGFGVRSVVAGFDAPYRPVTDVRDRYGDLSSGGRTLLWRAAWDAWREHPRGTGVDTFRFTFDRTAPLQFTARDAHSVYLERLTERGLAGLLVFLAAMAVAAAGLGLGRRAARGSPVRGGLVAASVAGLSAIMVGAAVDWYWEIPAIRGLAFLLLAAGLVPIAVPAPRDAFALPPRWRFPVALRALPALVALGAVAVQFVPNRMDAAVVRSQRDVRLGDLDAARAAADEAIAAAPERPDGYTQRALIAEATGDLDAALEDLRLALHRSDGAGDWRVFVLMARVQAERGDVPGALRSLARGRDARPNGRFFRLSQPPPQAGDYPRYCTGRVQLTLEHCERLPRADGSWQLPGDTTTRGAAELPDDAVRLLLLELVRSDKHQRDEAKKLLRVLDARPARLG